MANKISVNFYSKVYKDQSLGGANIGKLIVAGDTAYLKKRVPGGTDVLETVTVTAVRDNGHTIEWDNVTTGVRAEDIVGISAKHSYKCAGPVTVNIAIPETGGVPSTTKMKVVSITINGGVFPVNVEEAVAGNGISAEFAQGVTDVINGYLAGDSGYCSYAITGTAGTQVLTLVITGTVLVPTAISTLGAGTAVFS
jgi:hypothetical protein